METALESANDRTFAVPLDASPLASERILALAIRAVEGAPALTAGEVRELANGVLTHHFGNVPSPRQAPPWVRSDS